MKKLTLKHAKTEAGAVSDGNTKMPGSTFALSARRCNVGGRLVNVSGSVCKSCYALRLQKFRPNVNEAWERNQDLSVSLIDKDFTRWVDLMTFQIRHLAKKSGEAYHRWFDSGDLPSLKYLKAIVQVAENTPEIQHWLPTREVKIVKDYCGESLDNLVVRVSSPMVGDKPLSHFEHTSTVHKKGQEFVGVECEAYKRNNSCGDCRACWSKGVSNVSYPLH